MRLISPYELEYELRSIEVHSMIVPFPTKLIDNLPAPIRVITTPEGAAKLNGNTEVRILECLHAKLAIGKKGAIFGSWNFSKSNYQYTDSPSRHIEGVLKIDDCDPIFHDLEKFFENWWVMARKPIEQMGENKPTPKLTISTFC